MSAPRKPSLRAPQPPPPPTVRPRSLVLEAIRSRPSQVNVLATARDAPGARREGADTETEMVKGRRAYDLDIRAQRGIDF